MKGDTDLIASLLPANMQATLAELIDSAELIPVVTICSRRYAVENEQDRITLDTEVHTDTDKHLPYGVLEFKSADEETPPPGSLITLGLRPIHISKFLWATGV